MNQIYEAFVFQLRSGCAVLGKNMPPVAGNLKLSQELRSRILTNRSNLCQLAYMWALSLLTHTHSYYTPVWFEIQQICCPGNHKMIDRNTSRTHQNSQTVTLKHINLTLLYIQMQKHSEIFVSLAMFTVNVILHISLISVFIHGGISFF